MKKRIERGNTHVGARGCEKMRFREKLMKKRIERLVTP